MKPCPRCSSRLFFEPEQDRAKTRLLGWWVCVACGERAMVPEREERPLPKVASRRLR